MKSIWTRMWRRRWLVVVGTMAIFLSVGAAAWAATGDGAENAAPGPAALALGDGVALALADAAGTDQVALAAVGKPGPEFREALKEKREQRIKRIEALMKLVREKMTPEDQAAYDRLVQTAKDQRAALQQAKENLGTTLKDLRDLTDKYIGVESSTGGPAGTSTTVQ